MNKFIRVFFYGNLYLGVCAVALCIETSLLIDISPNHLPFYFLIFVCTCIYYTTIYIRSTGARNYNERTLWYRRNIKTITKACKITIALACTVLILLIARNTDTLVLLTPLQIFIIIAFPLAAGWYTFSLPLFGIRKIRQTGWIKPFIIGLTWTGWVTVYPLIIRHVQTGEVREAYIFPSLLLCLQNFLFFFINAVIFDIKDYQTDFRHRLKTFPVLLGIRKAFRFVILPAVILNIAVFFIFQQQQSFSPIQTSIQLIPYLLLMYTIFTYRRSRSILYYLVAVDGLVFVKAVCGITSILFLNKL